MHEGDYQRPFTADMTKHQTHQVQDAEGCLSVRTPSYLDTLPIKALLRPAYQARQSTCQIFCTQNQIMVSRSDPCACRAYRHPCCRSFHASASSKGVTGQAPRCCPAPFRTALCG